MADNRTEYTDKYGNRRQGIVQKRDIFGNPTRVKDSKGTQQYKRDQITGGWKKA